MPRLFDHSVHHRVTQFFDEPIGFIRGHAFLPFGQVGAELTILFEQLLLPLPLFRLTEHAQIFDRNDRRSGHPSLLDDDGFVLLPHFAQHCSQAVLQLACTDRLFHVIRPDRLIVRFIGQYDTRFDFDHIQLCIEPNTVAGYKAFGRVLELLDQE